MSTALIVPAAGSGHRLGLGRPKAVAELAGTPIVRRTLARFIDVADIVEAGTPVLLHRQPRKFVVHRMGFIGLSPIDQMHHCHRPLVFQPAEVGHIGIVGHLGTILGKHKVNIASMSLGRDVVGGKALTVLSLDSVPAQAVLDELKQDANISNVKVVKL